MTTSTRTRPKDGLAKLRDAHDRLDGARKERARLGEESRAYALELQRATATLDQLARTSPDQFGPDGQPKPGSDAAKLRDKLDQAKASQWAEIIAGADQRIADLEGEVRRLTDENAVQLATDEFRGGEDDLGELDELADQMLTVLLNLEGRRAQLIQIAASCNGRIDGRAVFTDDRLDRLRDLLLEHASFRPPRVPILSPLVGEEPRVVRGKGGGWINASHGSDNYADEQPPKLEPRR